jgi:hypothetical protein
MWLFAQFPASSNRRPSAIGNLLGMALIAFGIDFAEIGFDQETVHSVESIFGLICSQAKSSAGM